MPTPAFITELRSLIGHRPLWLSCAVAVVLDSQGRLLLGRRADTGQWALPGGIIEPGEQPADACARECLEETGVIAVPEVLTSVTVAPPHTYANGDQVQYLELIFRCRPVGGEAHVNDEESLAVDWFPLHDLPQLDEANQHWLTRALENTGTTAFHLSGPSQRTESSPRPANAPTDTPTD